MFATPIEALMLSLGANTITDIMLVMLAAVFVSSVYFKRQNKFHGYTSYTPTLLTTLGILGTFAGIIAGLLAFNVDKIDDSIGGLLDGLKTAFITSLVGMSLSIAYKLLQNAGILASPVAEGVNDDEVGVGELYAVMQQQAEGINSLARVIGGNENDSLVSQLKLFRSDVQDQNKKLLSTAETSATTLNNLDKTTQQQQQNFAEFEERLWRNLQDFADMLSKSATEQVINALKEVISDFNNNLTEQFGENFKQLNEAVIKLVEWQENYKLQLQQMGDQYAQGVTAISKTEESVTHISNETKAIPEAMQNLQQIMRVNQHQINELERHVSAFEEIRDRAVQALPEIKNHIDTAVAGMQQAADTMSKGITDSAQTLQKAIIEGAEDLVESSGKVHSSLQGTSDVISQNSEKIRTTLDDAAKESNAVLRDMVAGLKDESKTLQKAFQEAGATAISEAERIRRDFEAGMESMRSNLSKTISEIAEQQKKENQNVLNGMSSHAEQALKNTGEAVEKQVAALDQALQHELHKVMSEMGRALASISGKFTQDYSTLTEKMHNITRMSAKG